MINKYSTYQEIMKRNKKIENEDTSGEKYYKYLTSYGQYQQTSARNTNADMTDSGGKGSANSSPTAPTAPTTPTAPTAPTAPTTPTTPTTPTYNTTSPTNPYNPGTPGWTAWNQAHPQTQGTPAASTTPATNGGAYANYLISPMSAQNWQKTNGVDTEYTYDKAIRESELDYLKSQATYGQKAEQLGQAGLSGSGYGDYINGVGFASMQNTKVAASEQKAVNDINAMNAYGQYVAGVGQVNAQMTAQKQAEEAQKAAEEAAATQTEQGYKDTIVQMAATGMSYDDVKKYIMDYYKLDDATATTYMANMYQLGADQYAKTQTATTQGTADEANAAQLKINQTALEYASSYDGNTVREMLKNLLGATPEQIETAMKGVSGVSAANMSSQIASITDVTQVPTAAQINALKGTVSDEEIANLITTSQNKRAELLMKEFNTVDDTTVTAFFEKVESMKGEISPETYKALYVQRTRANLAASVDANQPVADALALKKYIDGIRGKVGEDVYNAMLNEINNSIKVDGFDNYRATNGKSKADLTISVNGSKDKVTVDMRVTNDITEPGEENKIISKGGKLYIYRYNKWNEMTITAGFTGSDEAAAYLTQILAARYSVDAQTYSQSISSLPSQKSPAARKTTAQGLIDNIKS